MLTSAIACPSGHPPTLFPGRTGESGRQRTEKVGSVFRIFGNRFSEARGVVFHKLGGRVSEAWGSFFGRPCRMALDEAVPRLLLVFDISLPFWPGKVLGEDITF